MATILKPDKIITTKNGLTIKQKIIPDAMTAPKDVASWCKKGQKMKPCAKLNNGTGRPKGITVHNTADIETAAGTNAAEQYTRATFNGNMGGVVVHFYVWDAEIWQNLREDERGWHAADGSTRRTTKDGKARIGGNLDTIAIECIGDRKLSEDTTAKLVAYLCDKYGLRPDYDVYQHHDFYSKKDCPKYIRPHWNTFLATVKKYYTALRTPAAPTISPYVVRIACTALFIRTGAEADAKVTGIVKRGEAYTIVEEKNGFGRLKSGAGWICVKAPYVERVKK